jgi:aspartyl-tRNA(Asn)/glutamyl-tRNA(Gln) amidotransferase subunit A
MEIRSLTIDQVQDGLRARRFSSVELASEALKFAREENPKTNAYLTFSEDRALEAARRVDGQLARG